jgi:hypothetical protein
MGFSEICKIHINKLCRLHVAYLKFKPGGAYRNHKALNLRLTEILM